MIKKKNKKYQISIQKIIIIVLILAMVATTVLAIFA